MTAVAERPLNGTTPHLTETPPPADADPALADPPMVPVHVAFARVMRQANSVGKNSRNDEAGFAFRGIDDVLAVVGPALRKHGVLFLPTDSKVKYETVELTRAGHLQVSSYARVRVSYTVIGPAGDILTEHDGGPLRITVVGEAMDDGDKAVSKAFSVAYRIALLQAFAIPIGEEDPAASSYSRAVGSGSRGQSATDRRRRQAAAQDGDREAPPPPLSADLIRAKVIALGAAGGERCTNELREWLKANRDRIVGVQVADENGELVDAVEWIQRVGTLIRDGGKLTDAAPPAAKPRRRNAPAPRTGATGDDAPVASGSDQAAPATAPAAGGDGDELPQFVEEIRAYASAMGVPVDEYVQHLLPQVPGAATVNDLTVDVLATAVVDRRGAVAQALRDSGRGDVADQLVDGDWLHELMPPPPVLPSSRRK